MKVHKLGADTESHQILLLQDEDDWDKLKDWFLGTPIAAYWKPLKVGVQHDAGFFRRSLPPSDFTLLNIPIPVFSQRAVEALEDLLSESGEILPLNCSEGVYFAFNTTDLIDALDEGRCEFKRLKDGSIYRVIHYEFHADKLVDRSIFKVPQLPTDDFVTDEFVRRAQQAGLSGFDFRLLWSGPDA